MSSITFDDWSGGLDVRRGQSVTSANRLRVLKNAYVTTGKALQKRPCLLRIGVLESGTVGLKAGGGKLNTFYSQGTITHANTLFNPRKLEHPTIVQNIVKVHYGTMFNGFLYAVAQYADGSVWHHWLDGTNPTHIADVNCPQTKAVTKQANKIWAIKNDVVRFCATNLPRDWTLANDAGFLPTGLQQEGSTDALALSEFQKQLVVFFEDGAQVWNIDPDPAQHSIEQRIYNVGTRYPKSPGQLSDDVFYLSDNGFRSVTVSQVSTNLTEIDVGSAVDSLVKADLIDGVDPESAFFAGAGQFWCFIGNKAWVYSFSKTAKVAAWSEYNFPITVDAIAELGGQLYVRSGDIVYRLDKETFLDDGQPVEVDIEMPYLDFKKPGELKQIYGVDTIMKGSANLSLRFDPRNTALISSPVPISGETPAGAMTGVEILAANVAPRITHSADEDFRLDSMIFYFENLGPQ